MWRPKEGWVTERDLELNALGGKFADSGEIMDVRVLYEAGADAMLKAVKRNDCVSSTSLRNTGEIGWKNLKDGFWYFIPEE